MLIKKKLTLFSDKNMLIFNLCQDFFPSSQNVLYMAIFKLSHDLFSSLQIKIQRFLSFAGTLCSHFITNCSNFQASFVITFSHHFTAFVIQHSEQQQKFADTIFKFNITLWQIHNSRRQNSANIIFAFNSVRRQIHNSHREFTLYCHMNVRMNELEEKNVFGAKYWDF